MKNPHPRMTAAELAHATREFDRPSPKGDFRPMTRSEHKEWKQIVKRSGRPRKRPEDKVARVLISMHPELLAAAHRLARRSGNTLSGLIADYLSAAVTKKRRSA